MGYINDRFLTQKLLLSKAQDLEQQRVSELKKAKASVRQVNEAWATAAPGLQRLSWEVARSASQCKNTGGEDLAVKMRSLSLIATTISSSLRQAEDLLLNALALVQTGASLVEVVKGDSERRVCPFASSICQKLQAADAHYDRIVITSEKVEFKMVEVMVELADIQRQKPRSLCSGALRAMRANDNMLEFIFNAMQDAKSQFHSSRGEMETPAKGFDESQAISKAKVLDERRWNHARAGRQRLQAALDHLTTGLNDAVVSLTGHMGCNEDQTQLHLVSRVQLMYKSQQNLQDILTMVASVA